MIKTLLQQLEDWFAAQDYESVERVLGGLPLEKFTPRMWELFGRSLLQIAQKDEPFSPVRYWRAFNCMSYMLNEQVELFADFNYYSALALAHLDREAEALLFLFAYLEDVMPELRHPHTEELELECLQRISSPIIVWELSLNAAVRWEKHCNALPTPSPNVRRRLRNCLRLSTNRRKIILSLPTMRWIDCSPV